MSWHKLPRPEKANVLTHAPGILLFAFLGYKFIFLENPDLSPVVYFSMLIFFFSAILVYSTSTIYHLTIDINKKYFWRNIDHIAIFFLIGGTYQPFIMMFYSGEKGTIFMAIMWSLVLIGVFYKLFIKNSWGWFSTAIYLGLGWMVVFIIKPLLHSIGNESLIWLIIGGLAYSFGVFFYRKKSIPYHHSIWHLFVLAGTLAHYFSIMSGIHSL